MLEARPHILDSIFEIVKNPNAIWSQISSRQSEESESLSEESNNKVKMQILRGGLREIGLLHNNIRKQSIVTKEMECDSSGEYLEHVWELDLKHRQFK